MHPAPPPLPRARPLAPARRRTSGAGAGAGAASSMAAAAIAASRRSLRRAAPRWAAPCRSAPRAACAGPPFENARATAQRRSARIGAGQIASGCSCGWIRFCWTASVFFFRRPDELMRVDDTFLLQNAERDFAARAAQYGTFRKRFLFPFILPLAAMGLTMYSLCLLRCSRTRFSCLACSAGTIEAPRLVASSAR